MGKRFIPKQYQVYLETKACGFQAVKEEVAGVWAGYGNPSSDSVAFTFDDGPTPEVTDRIIEAFEKRNWQATFFQIGEKVKRYPDLARRVAQGGHEIGNHTMHHVRCGLLEADETLREEVESTQKIFNEILGGQPKWFRPPFGSLRLDQGETISDLGMGLAYWNGNPRDWKRPGVDQIVRQTSSYLYSGSIIVMHDAHMQTADAIEKLLYKVEKMGLRAVTFSKILSK